MTEQADLIEIAGSARTLPAGARIAGAAAPDARIAVSVYLRPKGEAALLAGEPDHGKRRALLAAHRTRTHAPDIAAIGAWARGHGLAVAAEEPGRRLVRLEGTAAQFAAAFGTSLHEIEHAGRRFRGRTGPLHAPAHIAGMLESVLGLDERPVATSKMVRAGADARGAAHLPNEIGRLYDFPTGVTGQGEAIALIELGGGYRDTDTRSAFQAMGLAPPSVVAVGVDGATNAPGGDADGEVALDIQVAGGVAPGAAIVVYFAPNTDQGFADAISQAVHDSTHPISVVSISWGGPESGWTGQAVATMNGAIEDAGTLGISVFVASGDSLATDGVSDGAAHVDFPASSPYAIGCGGTSLATSGGAITGETVWNDGTSGTGGGFSTLAPVPAFQKNVVPAGATGRGVPDVAGDAAPGTGYTVVVDGQSQTVGGTSAVAPLWAGLTALLNQSLARKLGFFLPAAYAGAQGFVDITTGSNIPEGSDVGFRAGPGWDACTGLGRPDGAKLLAALRASAGTR